jgi:hypothetical protein
VGNHQGVTLDKQKIDTQRDERMNSPKTTVGAKSPNETLLFRVGGISAFAIGIAYIVIIVLYAYLDC